MAEQQTGGPPAGNPGDLSLPKTDAGWGFRLEMATTNFLLGYWRHILGTIVLILVGTLVYSQVRAAQVRTQQAAAHKIADAEIALAQKLGARIDPPMRAVLEKANWSLDRVPYVLQEMSEDEQNSLLFGSPAAMKILPILFQTPDLRYPLERSAGPLETVLLFLGPPDDEMKTDLVAGADDLVAIANEFGGAGAAEAAIEAAELYRLAGDVEKERAAFVLATEEGGGLLEYAGAVGLARLDFDAGNVDAGLARLREQMTGGDDVVGQMAALELAHQLEDAGRKDEAQTVYTDFLARWPESPHADRVRELQGAAPVAPAGGEG